MVAVAHSLYPRPDVSGLLAGAINDRHVIFLQGFFPRGAGYYHAILRRELALFAAVHNLQVTCGELQPCTQYRSSCIIEVTDGDQTLCTTYEFLHWQDLIEALTGQNWLTQIRNSVKSFATHLTSGALTAFGKAHWRYAAAVAMPYLHPLLLAVLSLMTVGYLWSGFASFTLSHIISGALFGLCAYGLVKLGRAWRASLMRVNFNACASYADGQWPELDTRINIFADEIEDVVGSSEAQEIVLVGHSFGTQLAALTARLLLKRGLFTKEQRMGLLMLGDVSCHIGLLPGLGGARMREAVVTLGTQDQLPWLSLYSGKDVLCFNRTHSPATLASAGGEPAQPENFRWPVMYDAVFRSAMDTKTYQRRRLKFFHMHSQFIFAARRKEAHFDYIRAICSAAPLFNADIRTGA